MPQVATHGASHETDGILTAALNNDVPAERSSALVEAHLRVNDLKVHERLSKPAARRWASAA